MLRGLYKRSPRLRRLVRTAKGTVLFRLTELALAVARLGSFDRAMAVADRVGDAAYFLLGATRAQALEHLELVFGDELSEADRRQILRSSMRGFARSFCELARMDEIAAHFTDYVSLRGYEPVRSVFEAGAIVCSAHMGNWEALAAYFAQVLRFRVAAVARQLEDPRLNQLLVDARARSGVETILRDSPSAGRQILRILKEKGLLAMVIDQDTRVPSVTVPFLGRPARSPVAPAALAVRRNQPLVVAYCVRRPGSGLDLVVHDEALWPDASLEQADAIRDLTTRVNDVLSRAIREHPTQWPWWHRRWRRGPQPRLDPDAPIL